MLVVAIVVAGLGTALVLLDLGQTSPAGALGPPRFAEETASSGLSHTYDGEDTFNVGAGLAVFDCDDDGRSDVYLAGGANRSALYRNASPTGGALRFTEVPSPVTDPGRVTGAYPIDIDGDRIADLVVLRAGVSQLLRGVGDCRFEVANERWGVSPTPAVTMAFSATWEGSASLPTLAFGGYVEDDLSPENRYVCPDNELFRPAPTGQTYGPATALSPGFCPLSMLFSDWDGSGRRDLRVSNDRQFYDNEIGGEQLWRIEPGSSPRLYTEDEGWRLVRIWGMGIAGYDVTGDGLQEYYLTSQGSNTLQALVDGPSQPTYRDQALKRSIDATHPAYGGDRLPSTAWHPEFQDVNNDGFIDLFVSKGNVRTIPDFAMKDPNDLFIGQVDGTFVAGAEAAGIVNFDLGRGAALADFNADGLLDLIVSNIGTPVRLWRNVGTGTAEAPAPMGHWLAVRLAQPGPNADAIGAVIETRVGERLARREIVVGGGHVGGQLGWTHLGLGSGGPAAVRVTWPDGEVGPWMDVTPDMFVRIERGATAPTVWSPQSP